MEYNKDLAYVPEQYRLVDVLTFKNEAKSYENIVKEIMPQVFGTEDTLFKFLKFCSEFVLSFDKYKDDMQRMIMICG